LYNNAGLNTVQVNKCLLKWVAESARVARVREWKVEVWKRWDLRGRREEAARERKMGPAKLERYVWRETMRTL
jgi:hypothetical protein